MSITYDTYMRFVQETFDLSDDKTRKFVLSEDAQSQSIQAYTSKLYSMIVEKIDDIDFGTIPLSKGDITKIENYNELLECVKLISTIVKEYNENSYAVDIIYQAIENIRTRTRIFEKAYALNVEFPIVMYNVMALSCVSAVSYMINTCIEFIKYPDTSLKMALNRAGYKKTKDYMLFKTLEEFNKSCAKGDIDKVLTAVISPNQKQQYAHESPFIIGGIAAIGKTAPWIVGLAATGIGVAIAYALRVSIRFLRDSVYVLYNTKQSFSDTCANISNILKLNANNLQYRDTVNPDKNKVYARQMAIANTFMKLSDKFSVKMKTGEAKAKQQIDKEDKKRYTFEDLQANGISNNTSIF